ncbi:S9 family peptidase [Alterisphingorhabdus coralli]|uniref:S9 family peptidase n=1 Tax=Alterisphingorhabdus coralli TaxID=3071408 RepID=A0AA97I0D5_9SPHN|nr:S9 family peptidase [Parasphingorhabdus sp. SCSIO 66989]WOE75589.1 S9 family peptidase [Parasphingorhabdus sp. SCSIO 66989]
MSLSGNAYAEDAPRLFSAEDVFELEWADDPQISPDGKRVLYIRRSNDIMTDRTRAHVWLSDLEGRVHEPLLAEHGSYSSPRWSPDGSRIAYLRRVKGRSELFVRYLGSGRDALLNSYAERPTNLTWSPDGNALAFSMAVKKKADKLIKEPKKPKGAVWSKPARLIDRARYRTNASGFRDLAYDHIFILPAEGGTARQLTSGDFHHDGQLSFSPDGQEIVFSANRNPEWELQSREANIFSVNIGSGKLTQLTDAPGVEASPRISPNGQYIGYLQASNAQEPFVPSSVFVMDRSGGSPKELTTGLDRRVSNLQWLSNREMTFTYQNRGENLIGAVSLGGKRRVAVKGIGGTTVGRPYVSGDYDAGPGGALVYTKGSAYRPADIYASRNGQTRRLTSLNEDLLAHRDLGELREFTFASSLDGREIQGWMITPPDYQPGKRYPLIIEIHGGPHLAYGPHFSAELQRMAAAGYVVIYDNHRGSIGYGSEFANLLKYKYSSPDDFADHMSAVDWAIDNGFADQDNLFIAGGSAGGIATAYAIGLTNRFNAAVAAKPVINWVSKVLTADSYISQIANQFPGPPWEHLDHYWQRSPLSLVGNVETPTMLITGEVDYRTPISETEQFYQALQLRKVPSVMVRIPGANHGIAGRPSRLNAKTDYTLAWFEKYRKDEDTAQQE